MKISSIFSHIPFKKYLSGFLVTTILISQTIHVDFFDSALAGPENYRDIVSLVVDKDTYGAERSRILRYADDISSYLGGVRTSILVVDPKTPVSTIAQKNEKLYYEGDGEDGVSSLVGTVLIGNIPVPLVTKDGKTFPSVYPYVDFVDKSFVYDSKNSRYNYTSESTAESVEVWHGVINPSVGRNWSGASDISKIANFLDKTHEFYTKSGKFAPSSVPPKVFYYDGQLESKSMDARGLFQYSLSMKNAENIAYNRFTKYLLRDISANLQVFDAQAGDPDVAALYGSLGIPQGSDTLSDEQIKKLPDIQSRDVILGFLKNFKQIFNEKSLGDELLAVHNAGRYTSGAVVRADIAPISISLMDDIARATLKTSNKALTDAIDASLKSGIASKIVLFDKNTPTVLASNNIETHKKEYKNYYFGTPSETIQDPSQCTIARGFAGDTSPQGRSVLVEANAAFDIKSTQGHIDTLKVDTEQLVALHRSAAFSCFNPTNNSAKLLAYWGDNSILKMMNSPNAGGSADSFLFEASPATTFNGFSLPIFSLGGMKESSRISNPSIANCIEPTYQYALLQPYLRTYRDDDFFRSRTYTIAYPDEWNQGGKYNGGATPRFTCNTVHQVAPSISLASSLQEYSSRTCFAGTLFLNNQPLKTINNTCIDTLGFGSDAYQVDNTYYEDRYYHSIPSVWSHVSPTETEISAAKANGVTPSLAIDHIRFVEFLTPKGNIARLNYPNFFAVEGNDVASVRAWLKKISTEQWKAILDKESATSLTPDRALINQHVAPGVLPGSPVDWNLYVSDEMIEQIIQAKNWIHPDISKKYKKAIESMLSYSHVNEAVTPFTETAPKIPSTSDEYEIAYLGLPSSFSADFSVGSSSKAQEGYDTKIREIEGANISDESQDDSANDNNNPATQCGPPDGVPLAQWPAAIMCWIKAQFPPRIISGSCGPSTIGLATPPYNYVESPSSQISGNTVALNAFYAGARVIPHLPRSSLQLIDSTTIDLSLQKNDTYLSVLPDTMAYIEVKKITADGKNISLDNSSEYISISPDGVPVGEKGAQFIIESKGIEADITLTAYYLVALPDGTEIRINASDFLLRITPEYYDISLSESGSLISNIDVTSSNSIGLNVDKVLKNGTRVPLTTSVKLEIIDDISGQVVYSGSSFNPTSSSLPTDITKKIGVYRLLLTDTAGVVGEITFAVQSGVFSQVRIVPISSALVQGSTTIAMIRLLDRLGNPISPDLHSVKIDVSGGYIVDTNGEKKTTIIQDLMESQIPLVIGSASAGTLSIQATVDESVKNTKDITIYSSARIALFRDSDPKVGGAKVPVHVEIQDANGKKIPGFSSVASLNLPDGAGGFSEESITITDGVSEIFDYIPGTVSGNHMLSIDVPGVGSLSNIVFSLLPGDPMYIDHIKDNNNIVFTLRDRYANVASLGSFVGTIAYNTDAPVAVSFTNGTYGLPLKGGQYTLNVPGLKDSVISYTDDAGVHTINGTDVYTVFISGKLETIDFAPDYNARYTVLAGGSFLREGEDILYNTTPGQSQSLAVTTILDSQVREDVLFSIFPGGAYEINEGIYDSALESSISLSENYPLLTVSDLVTRKQVARVIYALDDATFEVCQDLGNSNCNTPKSTPTIRVTLPQNSDITVERNSDSIDLKSSIANILNIKKDGSIRTNSSVSFVSKNNSSLGFEMGIVLDGSEIAKLTYITSSSLSVAKLNSSPLKNTPTILSSGFSIGSIVYNPSNPNITGYKVYKTTDKAELDETKSGPSGIDGIGSLAEIPSVGWQGDNTMMLAYAAGDSVGEATRFFHTYTLVNLGDPVTHVDHGRPGTEIDGIDRTVGSIVARSNGAGIANFFHRDMNADGIEDLIVAYQDGYLELFLNHRGKFRSRGIVAYNKDIDATRIVFGDFLNDGFGDIVGLNAAGDFILIDNSTRKFARTNIILDDGSATPRHISQYKVYDMDADKRDDIVYITASGELGVLYGTSTAGTFTRKILDPTLGITLSKDPITTGGAIKTNTTPQLDSVGVSPTDSTTVDDSMLKGEVYYQYSHPTPIESSRVSPDTLSGVLNDISGGATGNRVDTFVRSQYAPAYGLDIQKIYTNTTHPTLYPDDIIQAKITIKNTSSATIRNIEYLDSIPKIFSLEKTDKYSVTVGGTTVNRTFDGLSSGDYDVYMNGRDLAPGESMEINYELVALPASYGEMIVDDLEKNTPGADIYGDVGFKTSTTCGASMLLWVSGPNSRDYTRTTHEFGSVDLPDGLAERLEDKDNNKVPDSVENMSAADRQQAYNDMSTSQTTERPLMRVNQNGGQMTLGFDDSSADSIIDATQNLLDGLSCGFGGGSCLNFPLNWAPLAPGSSPSLFGIPLNIQGMTPSSGLPIFSGLTGLQMMCGPVPCCIPTVYPVSPLGYVPGPACGLPSAGGMLGTWAPTNFMRVYVTPTLTLGMGTAICLGGPASAMGQIPPPGLSPLIQGGNCIVAAKAMPFCKGDGSASDGDVAPISGLGTVADTWNATSCHPEANTITESEDKELTTGIIGYLKNPDTSRLTSMYTLLAKRGNQGFPSNPLLRIGGGASSGGSEIGIEIDSNTKLSDIGSVIKLKNKRVASFPDFMMDWLTRQTEEITTSLFTPPSLTVIPPTSFGQNAQVDGSYKDFSDKLNKQFSQSTLDNIKQGIANPKPANTAGVPDSLKGTLGNTKGTLNSIKSAYNTIGKLPFISIKQSTIPLNIPWIDKRELDKYARTLESYKAEIDEFQRKMCVNDPSPACLEKKAKLQSGPFMSSVLANLKRIEEYRRFPTTLLKYMTWKERYIAQILCNINIVQQITGGWLRDNGIRFRKWAELYVLIRAIADGWQPILDIFADTSANCGVCRNERNNLQYWKFKLLSMLIPSIPVIKFPKWPDIILDLSDVRLGMSISLPNFDPRISPIRLPSLPSLSLGDLTAGASLPGFFVIPGIPSLPNLPDLPSLPKVKLPDLPPPPKLPKIAGSITAFLKIMKLISTMYCFYQKTFLVPEWQAGDIIAQRTERQGTLPFDFLNLSLPQFSLPALKNINVGSHVNYSLRSEFITEFARTAVKPVNQFQTDLNLAMPTKVGSDVGVQGVDVTIKPKLPYNIEDGDTVDRKILTAIIDQFEADKDVFMDIDQFTSYILEQLDTKELRSNRIALEKELVRVGHETQEIEKELLAYNDKRFNLLKDYVSSENSDIAYLQSIVNMMNSGISGELRPLIADTTATQSRSRHLLAQFNQLQDNVEINPSSTQMNDTGIDRARIGLESRLSRMLAANTVSPTSVPGIAEGYSPRYQGVYILTPSGVQTQLFDYISPLTEDARVDSVDIDQDGDTDYMYLLDGVLYVKYTWKTLPNKIQDNTVKISTVSNSDYSPYIPDYFHENLSNPKNLNFSFVPSSQDETEWRVEFFDRYLEWDHVDIGNHDERETPKSIIDMFLDISTTPTSNKTLRSVATRRSLMSVKDQGSFALQGRSVEIYTGALSISLSPGRVLYTGKDRVSILYKNQTNPNFQKVTLDAYTGYEFDEITEITTTGGKLFLLGKEDGSLYPYSDDFIGLPILPGMRIYASDAGASIRDHRASTTLNLGPGVTYVTYDLGNKGTQYEVSFPYINGYYYARLNNLTVDKNDRAGVILFAPQASSDDGAPIVDLPTQIRLPIYSYKTYQISEILTDLSSAEISIDPNPLVDSDGNNIPDDDFSAVGTGFSIKNNDLTFGSFVTPGKYNMSLKAVDEIGNIAIMPVIVEAYALIPQIQEVTISGSIVGRIPESIKDTPIHFFRVRPGEVPTLLDKNPTPTSLTGGFVTPDLFNSVETIQLNVTSGSLKTNNRGVFQLSSEYKIDIMPATEQNPMQILTMNASGSISHIHTLALPDNVSFIDVSKNNATSTGVRITPMNGLTGLVPANTTDTSIPGGMYLTDDTYHPMIAIARDGNIYRMDAGINLRYKSNTDYLTIEIVKGGIVIGVIEYKIEFFYTMK